MSGIEAWSEDEAVHRVRPDIYRTAVAFQKYQAALQSLPGGEHAPTEEQIAEALTRAAFRYFDQGDDGKLEFSAEKLAFKNRVADLRGPEYIVDVDGNGRVSAEELAAVPSFPLTHAEALAEFDLNGDAALSMYEFYRAMQDAGLRATFKEALAAREHAGAPPAPPAPPAPEPAAAAEEEAKEEGAAEEGEGAGEEAAAAEPEPEEAEEEAEPEAEPEAEAEAEVVENVIEVQVNLPERPAGWTAPAPATPIAERHAEGVELEDYLEQLRQAEEAREKAMAAKAKLAPPPPPPAPTVPQPPPAVPAPAPPVREPLFEEPEPEPEAEPEPEPEPEPKEDEEEAGPAAALVPWKVQHDGDGDGLLSKAELKHAILREYAEAYGASPNDSAVEATLQGVMGAFHDSSQAGGRDALGREELRTAQQVLGNQDIAWAIVQKIGAPSRLANAPKDAAGRPAPPPEPEPLPEPDPEPEAEEKGAVPPISAEAVAVLRDGFLAADADGDGSLSRAEWSERLEAACKEAGLMRDERDALRVLGAIDHEVHALFSSRPTSADHAVDIAVDGAGPPHKMGAGEFADLAIRAAGVSGGRVEDPFKLVVESIAGNLGLQIRPAAADGEWDWGAHAAVAAAGALPTDAEGAGSSGGAYYEAPAAEEAEAEWGVDESEAFL
eukprot:tig00000093_g3466.t1